MAGLRIGAKDVMQEIQRTSLGDDGQIEADVIPRQIHSPSFFHNRRLPRVPSSRIMTETEKCVMIKGDFCVLGRREHG